MAGQRPGVAKLRRAFGNSLDRCRTEWFAVRSHWHIEVIRARDAGRGGTLAHPSDAPADRERGRRSEWRCRPARFAAEDLNRQDETPGGWSFSWFFSPCP